MKKFLKQCLPTYEIIEKIGEGINGSVYKVKDMLKERAVKIVPIHVERSKLYMTETELDSKVSQDFHAVREYYEKIRGEGVVQIFDFHLIDRKISKNQAQATLVILMELCPFTLQEYVLDLFPLKKDAAMKYMKDLINVLSRISLDNGQVFLLTDFKPSNFLITAEDKLVIGDLGGLKRISSVSTIANAQFTPNWSAPELILKAERPTMLSAVYSFGLVCYFIWEAGLPYEEKDFTERLTEIKEKGVDFDHFHMPEEIKKLIKKCLSFEPSERPESFKEIKNIFDRVYEKNDTVEQSVNFSDPSVTIDLNEMTVKKKADPDKTFKKKNRIYKESNTNMEFIWVEGGSFVKGDFSDRHKGPKLQVDGFWLGKYPVTQWQWNKITNKKPAHFAYQPDHPVEQISWRDAVNFCSMITRINDGGFVFSIPTDVQWEFAARSCGKNEIFAGGSNLSDFGWYKNNSDMTTHEIGMKKPNGIGIYDMCGNVQELCEDYFNPKSNEKIIKGGAWNFTEDKCRTTSTRKIPADLKYSNTGLRLIAKSLK